MCKNKLDKFIDSHKDVLFGFYRDITGACCLNLGKYLITIFINTCTNELEICVDIVSDNGIFDNNVEWITPNTEDVMVSEIRRVVYQYSK